MNKQKLLFLLGSFALGGAENMVYQLAKNIDRSKYDVSILCYGARTDNFLSAEVEKIFHVEYLNLSSSVTIKGIIKVLSAIRKINPDVLHAHLGGVGFASLWSILTSKTVIITVHTKPEKAFSKKIEKILRLALKKKNTAIVAVSKENCELVSKYFDVSKEKSFFVNNGIDISRFYSENQDGFTVINVARHDENKNQKLLIESFADFLMENKKALLYLVGDGPTHSELIEFVKQNQLQNNVIFTGNISNVEEYYAISDLYVQSSHREAFPLSVLEAMAAGLPIVSTDVGGLKDVIRGNGFLIPDNDKQKMTQAISKVAHMGDNEYNDLKSCSLKIVEDFSSQKMAERYMLIYERMCGIK